MQNSKCKIVINFLLIFGLLTPIFSLAQTTQIPQTMGEAESFIKNVWCNQVLPLWQKAWAWIKSFWDNTLGDKVQMLWQKFLGLLGKESPDVKEEFQKESEEMQKDIWQRFKELF